MWITKSYIDRNIACVFIDYSVEKGGHYMWVLRGSSILYKMCIFFQLAKLFSRGHIFAAWVTLLSPKFTQSKFDFHLISVQLPKSNYYIGIGTSTQFKSLMFSWIRKELSHLANNLKSKSPPQGTLLKSQQHLCRNLFITNGSNVRRLLS